MPDDLGPDRSRRVERLAAQNGWTCQRCGAGPLSSTGYRFEMAGGRMVTVGLRCPEGHETSKALSDDEAREVGIDRGSGRQTFRPKGSLFPHAPN